VLETFECYGCMLTSADYGDLNYGTNDPVQVAMTIRFDNAVQTAGTVGVGTLVGRQTATSVVTGSTPPFVE